jgi:ketosteroid isomerase-like protein
VKRILFLAALVFVTSASGQTRKPTRVNLKTDAEQKVKHFEREYIEARRQARRGDTTALERLLDDDFIATSLNGRVVNKAQFIRNSRNPNLRFTSFNIADTNIRVYGNSAVATGLVTVTSRAEDKVRSLQFRYTNLYVGTGGLWKMSASHLTPVAQQ